MDPLIEALNDNRIWVKTSAAVTLGFIGKAAAKAAPAMSALINHKDTDLRQAAALGLAAIAPERRELVPVLIELVKEDDISISTTALTLLQQIDPKAADEVGPK